jgi:hypothetical protein
MAALKIAWAKVNGEREAQLAYETWQRSLIVTYGRLTESTTVQRDAETEQDISLLKGLFVRHIPVDHECHPASPQLPAAMTDTRQDSARRFSRCLSPHGIRSGNHRFDHSQQEPPLAGTRSRELLGAKPQAFRSNDGPIECNRNCELGPRVGVSSRSKRSGCARFARGLPEPLLVAIRPGKIPRTPLPNLGSVGHQLPNRDRRTFIRKLRHILLDPSCN